MKLVGRTDRNQDISCNDGSTPTCASGGPVVTNGHNELPWQSGDSGFQCGTGGRGLHCGGSNAYTSPPPTFWTGLYKCCTSKGATDVLADANAFAGFALSAAILSTAVLLFSKSRAKDRSGVLAELSLGVWENAVGGEVPDEVM